MLNVFPDFLSYSLAAPLLLRIVVGAMIVSFGYKKFTTDKERLIAFFIGKGWKQATNLVTLFGALEAVAGLFMVVGFFTQIMALLIIALVALEWYENYSKDQDVRHEYTFVLIIAISVSILFSGAGLLAIDLPL